MQHFCVNACLLKNRTKPIILNLRPMKKYLIKVLHPEYEELWATTNDFNTAVKYAREAIIENEGKKVVIK
jgi:hypothetical protein